MTSRNLVVGKVLLSGAMCLGLAACSGSNSPGQNRVGYNGVNGTSFGTIQVAPNGSYTVGNVSCNANDTNPNDVSSPYYSQGGPCHQLLLQQQQVANGQVPPQYQQQQQVVQPQQVAQGPMINPSLPPGQGGPGQYNQQQQQQQAGAQVYPLGPISRDIGLDGRIKGPALFKLREGAGEETIEDNCFNGTGYDADGGVLPEHTYRAARFLKDGDAFTLQFDSRGSLLINLKSETGLFSSNGPVPYQLDADSQTIHIGSPDDDQPIVLSGPASQTYAEHEAALQKVDKRIDDIGLKDALSIKGNLPSDFIGGGSGGAGGGSTGFVLGPQAGGTSDFTSGTTTTSSSEDCSTQDDQVSGHSTVNPNGGGAKSKNNTPATGITLNASSNGGLADQIRHSFCHPASSTMAPYSSRKVPNRNNLVFDGGITANIKVHPNQQQHIVAMWIDTLQFHSYSYVSNSRGLPCEPKSEGQLHHLLIQ